MHRFVQNNFILDEFDAQIWQNNFVLDEFDAQICAKQLYSWRIWRMDLAKQLILGKSGAWIWQNNLFLTNLAHRFGKTTYS